MARSWIPTVQELSEAALTVRAQAISPNDNGRLRWDLFFPRRNVPSVVLDDVTALDFRPVADRREWNAPGRLIPYKTPARRQVEIVPINPYRKWGEREMQKMAERVMGNEALMMDIIGEDIPSSVDTLAESIYRRVEIDAMSAWATGIITQKNPQDGATYTASFGFSSSRLQTAGTAWNDNSVNAYDLFQAWLRDAIDYVGGIEGVVLRQVHINAILADAPDLQGGVAMTRAQLETRIQDDLGQPFMFAMVEDSLDVFTDGGTATTRTKVWPAQKIAAIPSGGTVGYTAFAPVVRAMDIARNVPQAGVDVRGVTAYYDEAAVGRELTLELQANALPVPDENKVFVIDVGF